MENVFPIIDIDEAANDFGWAFEVHPGGVFFFTGEYVAAACAFVPDLQEWYHLAVTYDRGAGTVTFYINGNVACQSNYSEDIEDTVGDPIYVGWSKAGPDEYSNGVIDELVVFDRALTLPEIQALYHGSGGGTGWLSIHPNSGTVPTNSSVPLQATSDSTDLQPAVYPGNISIFSNDPLHSLVQVPVTMTVLPTPSMGWVEGTVTDLRSSDPMVASISAAGQPYTVTSSLPNGRYRLWLEPGAYELHVSAPGYIAQTRMVDIQTQQGATQDFSLLLDAPWLQSSPESLASTQAPGAITNSNPHADKHRIGPARLSTQRRSQVGIISGCRD